jgi:hypothetical protein
MGPSISIQDDFTPALIREFALSRRRPDLAKTLNDVMGFWLSFAMAKVTNADKGAMERAFKTAHRGRGLRVATGAKADMWRGTYAAAILAAAAKQHRAKSKRLQWTIDSLSGEIGQSDVKSAKTRLQNQLARARERQARRAAGVAKGQLFYDAVAAFAASTKSSGGYMKAGFIPALGKFRPKRMPGLATSRPPKLDSPPGSAASATVGRLEAMIVNEARGIVEMFPGAFNSSRPQVAEQIRKMIAQNLQERAARMQGQ